MGMEGNCQLDEDYLKEWEDVPSSDQDYNDD